MDKKEIKRLSKISSPDEKEYAEDWNTGKIDLYKEQKKEEEKLRHGMFGEKYQNVNMNFE